MCLPEEAQTRTSPGKHPAPLLVIVCTLCYRHRAMSAAPLRDPTTTSARPLHLMPAYPQACTYPMPAKIPALQCSWHTSSLSHVAHVSVCPHAVSRCLFLGRMMMSCTSVSPEVTSAVPPDLIHALPWCASLIPYLHCARIHFLINLPLPSIGPTEFSPIDMHVLNREWRAS